MRLLDQSSIRSIAFQLTLLICVSTGKLASCVESMTERSVRAPRVQRSQAIVSIAVVTRVVL